MEMYFTVAVSLNTRLAISRALDCGEYPHFKFISQKDTRRSLVLMLASFWNAIEMLIDKALMYLQSVQMQDLSVKNTFSRGPESKFVGFFGENR